MSKRSTIYVGPILQKCKTNIQIATLFTKINIGIAKEDLFSFSQDLKKNAEMERQRPLHERLNLDSGVGPIYKMIYVKIWH